MKKSTGKVTATVFIMLLITVAILFGYFKMTQKPLEEEETVAKTEIEKLLKKDMEHNYPGTSREVLKLYGRMTQCMYNDNLNEKQVEGLLDQLRKLYDEELLEQNPRDTHLENLYRDIEDYQKHKRKIMSYTVQKSSQIKAYESNGKEYAVGYMLFITGDDTTALIKTYEKFMLRKDTNGNWKVVGWDLVDPDSIEIEED